MSESKNIAKIQQLVRILRENPRDIEFIRSHLSPQNQELLTRMLIEEKVTQKKPKRIKTVKPVCQTMISVFNNPKLASELGVALAKHYKNRTIAILDADRFCPQLDVFLNTKSHIKSVYTHLDYQRATGLNLLIDASHKHVLTKKYAQHLSLRVKGFSNIHFFSGSYLLEDYEYFKLEDYKKVVQFLRTTYDLLIIHTNGFIYDAFTIHSLMISDCNLISCHGVMYDIKEKLNYVGFIEKKQRIERNKNIFVLFDFNKQIHVDFNILKQGVDYRLVKIASSKCRKAHFNHYPLTHYMSRQVFKNYVHLLNQINEVCS